ncbi:hypothetical protein HW130_04485 [Streptomyces sp. PKU-EA00015]|uniref:hypothetical protein n=1 Tax=Streptomyces sp. PKU-EA00015 TaxID=2748326 RepID=UPI0015A0A76D|nr:hypothetical protein [Streptomyces sp. PKU-EA00015]NWF25526.1 hypothetical protein [Streptomyces sp. PKU-EA00015]
MTGGRRFHLDQDGHSVTVQLRGARPEAEVLVDGKVVAYRRGQIKATTALEAELPGDPPRPFRVLIAPVEGPEETPLCMMESAGARYLMPLVPLLGPGRPPQPGPSPTLLVRRRLRRLLHRRAGRR